MRSEVRRLLRPWWLLSHLLVASLLVATVNLGFWQLRRLDARQVRNAEVSARADVDPVPLAEAFGPLKTGAEPDDQRHVQVVVEGIWDPDHEVLWANRSLDGGPGVHAVTLLRIDGIHPGVGVAVDRGFVARSLFLDGARSAWEPAGDPGATVMLEGTLDAFRAGERGHGDEVDRLDRVALEARWGLSLAPMWVRAAGATGSGDWPVPVPATDLGEGSHLSYAVQWFVFTVIGLVGYPLVLVRLARRGDGAVPLPHDSAPGPDGDPR